MAHKQLFLDFFKFSRNELGLKVILLPFHLDGGGLSQSRLLKSWDEDIEVIDISVKGYLPVGDAMSIISNAEFVVSCRYHALVFAVQSGTPIFSIMRNVLDSKSYYFNKNYGFLEAALGRNFDPNLFLYGCYTSVLDKSVPSIQHVLEYQSDVFKKYLETGVRSAQARRLEFFKDRVLMS